MTSPFFDEMREQSLIKATIVSKYFWAWATVMISTIKKNQQRYGRQDDRLAYVDLFAGPGRYQDGKPSTPLLILERALKDDNIRDKLVTIFNDKDAGVVRHLRTEIEKLSEIGRLKYKPQIMNKEVDLEMVEMIEHLDPIPTLFFVDPFGYKGLTQSLINVSLQNWGSECIFFFNYNRVSMDLPNELVREHMDALFGKERADQLRKQITLLTPQERELTIVEALVESLENLGANYVLPFRFKNERGTRTSHHLIFASKRSIGYEIMKKVMAGESASEQGVPTFEYNPATERQPFLFELLRPLDQLGDMLLNEFAGKTVTMRDLYVAHSVGRPFLARNYKDILIELESAKKIKTNPPIEKRRPYKGKPSFADGVMVTFPPKS